MRTPLFFVLAVLGVPVGKVWAVPDRPVSSKPITRPEGTTRPGGSLALFGNDGKPLVCPLKHTEVTADVSGFVSRVTVEQTFHNPARSVVEALYSFPLPSDSAVDAMTMLIGSRRIEGQIKRREEARRIYEAAKAAGKTAALLDQERPNIFTQSVANILPGHDVKVRISYVNRLQFENGVYEWAFPTVVGPRYTSTGGYSVPGQRGEPSQTPVPYPTPDETTSRERDADKITPPITPEGIRAGHDISLRVNLDMGVPLGEVNSALHPISVTHNGKTKATITLKEGATLPNKDFVLRFRTASDRVETGLLTHTDERGGFFTLFFQPPPAPKPEQIAPRELIFAIDQTGSQAGWPIEKAKATMQLAMKALRPGDTFNLLGFNTSVYPCFPKAVPATATNIAKARNYLKAIEADGGTDILKSVDYILRLPADPARLRMVCYMTDGYVGNDMQTIAYIRKHRGNTRIFPFGIGDGVNRFFIENMAKEGRGLAQVVTSADKSEEAAQKFITAIDRPVLLNPKVSFNGMSVTETFPNPLADLYANSPIAVSGRFQPGSKGNITVSGYASGKPWQQNIPVEFPLKEPGNSALPSLWARQKIEEIQASDWMGAQDGSPNPEVKEKIVQVALAYNLMSQYTSFVAVEQKVVNPGGAQDTLDTPVEMPNGVSYEGIFGSKAEQAKRAQAAARYALRLRTGEDGTPNADEFAARPGDPLIRIAAPADARQVVAVLPNGEIKTLVWNTSSRAWEAHFDIPGYAPEGSYTVTVIVLHRNGGRQRFEFSYRVDTSAPSGLGQITRQGAKWLLSLRTDSSTDRVSAFLPWGQRVELKRGSAAPQGSVLFQHDLEVPLSWQSRAPQARFVVTDSAHNRTEILLDLSP